jgi:hypothetical protein
MAGLARANAVLACKASNEIRSVLPAFKRFHALHRAQDAEWYWACKHKELTTSQPHSSCRSKGNQLIFLLVQRFQANGPISKSLWTATTSERFSVLISLVVRGWSC